MSGKRWARWLAAPIAFVAVALLLSRFQAGAEAGGKTAAPTAGACAGSAPLGRGLDQAAMAAGHGTWWRLTDALDPNGQLVGRTLFAGRAAKTTLTMQLGAESMARGPIGGLLVVTTDDGAASELRLVWIAKGCSWLLHRDANVVRSAILDPLARTAYAHVVRRDTRADLGIFRVTGGDVDAPLDRILEPLEAQPDLGPIWATELRLDANGASLAAQACSDQGCLTRVVSVEAPGNPFTIVRGDSQGSIIGFAGERIVAWGFCAGLPCAVEAWTPGPGKPQTLANRVVGAGLTKDGRYVLLVTDGAGHAFRIDLATNTTVGIPGVGPGELPIGASVTATSGLDVADDQVGLVSRAGDPHALSPGAAVAP